MRAKLSLFLTAAVCLAMPLRASSPQVLTKGSPISFEKNDGQVAPEVRYLAHLGKNSIFFTPSEAVLELSSGGKQHDSREVLRTRWVGGSADPAMHAENELPGRVNYLIGNDPAKWHTNLPTFARVRYESLYPGVNAVFYGKDGEIEYDLQLAPGA